ncbi:unnamed protein product [Schistosoma curassoni]|nr:unnamed protein product [Schistosoma curassoni]
MLLFYDSFALRHWFREGFRGTVYLGVPLLMLILGNMPSTPEYVHNMVRDRYLKSTGDDIGEFNARTPVKPID